MRAILSSRRAVATVEFAILAPILVTSLGAAVDLARAIEQSIALQSIARAGASYAALVPSDAQNSAEGVMTALLSSYTGATASVSISCKCPASTASSTGPNWDCNTICTTGTATYVAVSVSAPFSPMFPLGNLLPYQTFGAAGAQITLRVS